MFFVLSKVLWAVADPGNVLTILLVAGVLFLFAGAAARRIGRVMVVVATLGFVGISLHPVAYWTAAPLEDAFPRPVLPDRVDGIIMLGGAASPVLMRSRGEASVNGHAERLFAFVELGRRYPDARMVSSGGSGLLLDQESKESAAVRAVMAQVGVEPGRVTYEDASRNTWENAVFTRDLVRPAPGEVWVLVTSALHMPRSVGIFRQLGWPVIPYPVDFNTPANAVPIGFGLSGGLGLFSLATREWIGLVAYRIMGRTSELLPAAAG